MRLSTLLFWLVLAIVGLQASIPHAESPAQFHPWSPLQGAGQGEDLLQFREQGDRPAPDAAISVAAAPWLRRAPSADTIDFGLVAQGAARDTVIRLMNDSSAVIDGFAFLSPVGRNSFALEQFRILRDSFAMAQGGSDSIIFSFRPTAFGTFTAMVIVGHSSGADSIIVTGRTARSFATFSDTIDFGIVDIGSCRHRTDSILNLRQQATQVNLSLEDPSPVAFQMNNQLRSLQLQANSTDTFGVRFCPSVVGPDTARLVLISALDTQEVVLIGIGNQPLAVDSIIIDPTDIDFGSVPVGTCRERTFNITSNYAGVMSLNALLQTLIGNDTSFQFATQQSRFTIDPFESIQVTLRYCPTEPDSTVTMVMLSDGAMPPRAVTLRGLGVEGVLEHPSQVTFKAARGECDTQSVRISNAGEGLLLLQQIQIQFRRSGFTLIPPVPTLDTLGPGQWRDLRVSFCPDNVTSVDTLDSIQVVYKNLLGPRLDVIRLIGTIEDTIVSGPAGVLSADVDSIDFGQIVVNGGTDSCRQRGFRLVNIGSGIARLDSVRLRSLGQSLPPGFSIVEPTVIDSRFHSIRPGEFIPVVVQYCPSGVGRDSVLFQGMEGGAWGARMDVVLKGEGIAEPKPVAWRVWLDSNLFPKAGAPFRLWLNIHDPVEGSNWMVLDSVKISFTTGSFVATGVGGNGLVDETFTLRRDSDRRLTIIREAQGRSARGNRLLWIELVGLTTGVAQNSIMIDSFYFAGPAGASVTIGGAGFVLLSGCGLGSDFTIAPKVTIHSIQMGPGSGDVAIRYIGPEGVVPQLHLLNLGGQRVLSRDLPVAGPDEQEVRLPLDGVSPGFYIVELRMGDERSSVPIMIAE